MKIFTLKDISSEKFLATLFPVDDETGEVNYDYKALQVLSFVGSVPLIMVVDSVRHHLATDSFIYGLTVHPDSEISVYNAEGDFTFCCQPVSVPYDPSGGDSLLVEQPKDESDAYDAFLQAHKTLHQNIYSGEYEDEDDSDLDQDHVLSDYEDDEIPTPYELADDPMADEIEDRLRRVPEPADPPEPPAVGSDVPPAKPKEGSTPQE